MSSYEYELSMWPEQRDRRVDLNDTFSTPRAVEHFAYFRRRGSAKSAAAELAAAGYTVTLDRSGFKTVLEAARNEPLTDEAVARFLREVITIVERHRGEYDGWGATVEAQATAES